MGRRSSAVAVAGLLLSAVAGLAPAAQAQAPAAAPTEAGSTDWARVSTGYDHTCGIRTTGRLYCWGDDGDGQLGNDAILADQPTPVQVAGT